MLSHSLCLAALSPVISSASFSAATTRSEISICPTEAELGMVEAGAAKGDGAIADGRPGLGCPKESGDRVELAVRGGENGPEDGEGIECPVGGYCGMPPENPGWLPKNCCGGNEGSYDPVEGYPYPYIVEPRRLTLYYCTRRKKEMSEKRRAT